MRSVRFSWIANASPEELFLIGGEDMSPVYPLPADVNTAGALTSCTPYGMGEASIEHMQNEGAFDGSPLTLSEIIRDRDERTRRILKSVIQAAAIEKARSELAQAINQAYFND